MGMARSAAELLVAHRPGTALTGAGVSVESGVPDFRSPGGIWETFDPDEYATAEALAFDPDKTWVFFASLFELVGKVKPGAAHRALADLGTLGVLRTVVTQNIDGLHQAAGSADVVEYHGGPSLVCMGCGQPVPPLDERQLEAARRGRAPRHACGGIVRPAVVLFGEEIPAEAMRRSIEAVHASHSLLVAGTSAQVWPAAGLPRLAAQQGAPVIEVNLEETPVTRIAAISIRGRAGEVLPEIAWHVRRLLGLGG